MHITVTPAYGRDYKSRKEIATALSAGEDFVEAQSGRYISLPEMVGLRQDVNVRYKAMRAVAVFTPRQLSALAGRE